MNDPGRIYIPNAVPTVGATIVLADEEAAVGYEPYRAGQVKARLQCRHSLDCDRLSAIASYWCEHTIGVHPEHPVQVSVADVKIACAFVAENVPQISEIATNDRD